MAHWDNTETWLAHVSRITIWIVYTLKQMIAAFMQKNKITGLNKHKFG